MCPQWAEVHPLKTGTRQRSRPSRPPLVTEVNSARLAKQRRKDTTPELALRRALFAAGLRYRIDFPPLPEMRRRRADVVFSRARVAVFVDGCFWHSCPLHGSLPRANRAWWAAKLEANRARDAETDEFLATHGWVVLRYWEHCDPIAAAAEIAEVVRQIGEKA